MLTAIRNKVKVLVVDDSAVIRKILTERLQSDEEIEVVGTSPDAYIAFEKINRLCPDVITLDVEMPGMDGITFLEKLMKVHPLPVIVVSSITQAGSKKAIEALQAGAVEVICKPVAGEMASGNWSGLAEKIKAVRGADINEPVKPESNYGSFKFDSETSSKNIIAIGASTGGVQALTTILSAMPANSPGIAVVQHMPELFTKSFAKRLNSICAMEVCEAAEGDILEC